MSPWIRRRLPLGLATCFSAALLLSSLGSSGIGEPFELDAADRARRFAADALGARGLLLDGLTEAPIPPDLTHGPLPTAAVALGFRLFGATVWAGRLPLALVALAGVLALAFFLARLVDRRAAAYGVVTLITMPLFFVQARTMLGDAVAMGASSMAVAGLGVLVFDRKREQARLVRGASLALAVAGLVAGGLSRGAVLGVAVPSLGVGVAWLILGRRRDALADAGGALALLVGAAAIFSARQTLGGAEHPPFDAVFHQLGHALFPWSALLPLAFVALLSSPPAPAPLAAGSDAAARTVILAGAVAAFAVQSLGSGGHAVVPFTSPALLAAAIAVAARDLDRRSRTGLAGGLRDVSASRAAGVAAALLTVVLARDLLDTPDRALASIVPLRAGAPLVTSGVWVRAAAVVFAAVLAFVAFDRAPSSVSWTAPYLAWPHALRRTWGGRLATGLVAAEATFVSLALSLALRPIRAAALGEVPRLLALHAFWAFPLALVAVVWIPLGARDALLLLRRFTRLSRGGTVIGAGTLAGALLAWGHYPDLLGHLSPREALTRFAALRAPGEPLGALGVSARAATFEIGAAVRPLADATAAATFLAMAAPGGAASRAWLVLGPGDLPALNALVRARDGRNAAVLAGGAGGSLLVAGARLPGDPVGEGSLDDLVLSAAPPLAHPVEATVGDSLVALGWDLVDDAGTERGDALAPLRAHRLRLYYRVTGHLDDGLCSFVHIDGQGRRWSAEHREFHRYPMRFWRAGDVLVDEFAVSLGGNFTPGAYALRYGLDRLPCDGHARLAVKSGPHDGDNRIDGGNVHVR